MLQQYSCKFLQRNPVKVTKKLRKTVHLKRFHCEKVQGYTGSIADKGFLLKQQFIFYSVKETQCPLWQISLAPVIGHAREFFEISSIWFDYSGEFAIKVPTRAFPICIRTDYWPSTVPKIPIFWSSRTYTQQYYL